MFLTLILTSFNDTNTGSGILNLKYATCRTGSSYINTKIVLNSIPDLSGFKFNGVFISNELVLYYK